MSRATGRAPAKGTGTGSGRNKSRAKQREYREHCRIMRTTGHWCDSSGQWRLASGEDKIRYQDGMQK